MASISPRTLSNGESRFDVNYRDAASKKRRKTFTRISDAKAFARELEVDKNRGQFVDPHDGKQTFGSYADGWLPAQSHFAPGTREAVEQRFRKHIIPTFGNIPLSQIRPSTVAGWLAALPLADSTKQVVLAHVSSLLKAAMEDGIIAKNPALSSAVPRPKRSKPRVQVWHNETILLVRSLLPCHLQIMVDLGIGLGLRQGEILGLAVEDIEFLKPGGVVHVRRQRQELENGKAPIYKLPKGDKERDVPLPPSVRDLLSAHLAAYKPVAETLPWGNKEGRTTTVEPVVSHFYRGKPITLRRKAVIYEWQKATMAAGLPTGRRVNGMHMLRHYYASVLLENGVSVKALAEYMGHADVRETLETYAHLMPTTQDKTAEAIDHNFAKILGGTPDVTGLYSTI